MFSIDKKCKAIVCVVAALALATGCATGPQFSAPPLTPVNMSPIEESDIVVESQTTFVWKSSQNAEYYDFHIFNNENKDIQQFALRNVPAKNICQGGQCQLTLDVALPYKEDHAWRVRAGNNVGLSGWTRTRFNMVGPTANINSSATN